MGEIGAEPIPIDLLTRNDGVDVEAAWSARGSSRFGADRVRVLSRRHLIVNEQAARCTPDLADVARLRNTPSRVMRMS